MRLIAGLGNPGLAYRKTRHNAGFMALDRLAQKHGITTSRTKFRARFGEGNIGQENVILTKPQTYMNLSGASIKGFLDFYRIPVEELIVVHDDMDMNLGRIRIKEGGGDGGHKGIRSIIQSARSGKFCRIKIGIGRPQEGEEAQEYVLRPFSKAEEPLLAETLSRTVEAIEVILLEGVQQAMNRFNSPFRS